MNIIVPMAGLGKRMRPHTLTTAKPLLPIAGKAIVERLMEDIVRVCDQSVQRIAFITSPSFGKAVEKQLLEVALKLGAAGSIHYQEEALGTAHAILCAREYLDGPVVVAFADTLFKADFVLDSSQEGIIWVKKVEDPRAFGVVELNEAGIIRAFHEKPEHFVSDLAIIGIYYFKDGAYLRNELQYLVDHGVMDKGEYQLTSALENMKSKGTAFFPGTVSEWLDCGNKDATVHTNSRYLDYLQERQNETLIDPSAVLEQCTVIPPCYIGADCRLSHVVLGPHVSVGPGSRIENAVIESSLVREHAYIHGVHLRSSMTGAYAKVMGSNNSKTPGTTLELSLSDYSEIICP
jgi:glucose-1-phosphate thymidylyltransferase